VDVRLYLAKIKRPNGDLLHPVSLYAVDDEGARAIVETSGLLEEGSSFDIGWISEVHEEGLGRHRADHLGAKQHFEQTWSEDGPLRLIQPFGD